MNKQFVPKEESRQLKDKGFNEKCFSYYIPNDINLYYHGYSKYVGSEKELIIEVPTYQQTLDWFRTEHRLLSHITSAHNHAHNPPLLLGFCNYIVDLSDVDRMLDINNTWLLDFYETYEEARLELVRELIKLL